MFNQSANHLQLQLQLQRCLAAQHTWRVLLLITILAILFLATTPHDYPIPASANDKLNHLFAFWVLGIQTQLAWPHKRRALQIGGLLFFGTSIEIIQYFLPNRHFDLSDILADGAGLLPGLWCAHTLLRRVNPRKTTH